MELKISEEIEGPRIGELVGSVLDNVGKAILGKPEAIRLSVITLLAGGHLLIEDIPGVGKSTLAHAIAKSVGGSFMRIQFTSDMMPSDIIGVSVYRKEGGEFEFVPGPVFHNFVLADEINRTSPRTQSALLEAMSDGKVSVDNRTYDLPSPFMILATQNPQEYHGTYPLPESQLDRFMMTIEIGYPDDDHERMVVNTQGKGSRVDEIEHVVSPEELSVMQNLVDRVRIEGDLVQYLLNLVRATRSSKYLSLGVSTRGAIFLRRAALASALVEGRDYVIPDDIKGLVLPVFSHRVVTKSASPSGLGRSKEARSVLFEILESEPVPM
jgi:MoxR-like ATPase